MSLRYKTLARKLPQAARKLVPQEELENEAQAAETGPETVAPEVALNSPRLNSAQVLRLQHTHGNQAVLRMLAGRKGTTLPPTRDDRAIQRKVIKWPNPVLAAAGVDTPAEGLDVAEDAAKKLNVVVEKAGNDVKYVITQFMGGHVAATDVANTFAGQATEGHIRNFVNKLIDWKTKGKRRGVKQAAGYIVEGHADVVAKNAGFKRQYNKGGAIPDYQVKSGVKYDFKGTPQSANTLLDSTSEGEALKGHIVDKVNRIGPKPAKRHPHLYDVYYDKLGIDDADDTTVTIDLNDPLVQKRLRMVSDRALAQARATKNRKKSLRSPRERRKAKSYLEELNESLLKPKKTIDKNRRKKNTNKVRARVIRGR